MRPPKPSSTVKRSKKLRKEMTKPEIMIWQLLRQSPNGHKFRKQHPAGPYSLDFFCAKANLAIEIDGFAHDTGGRPARDAQRDKWLRDHRIDTLRIPAIDVLKDAQCAAEAIIATVEDRISRFKKDHI
jgi:very-short-patch-repair endonuclease